MVWVDDWGTELSGIESGNGVDVVDEVRCESVGAERRAEMS